MIVISEPLRRFKAIRIHTVWLAERPRLLDSIRLARYYCCEQSKPAFGFIRFDKCAQEVDLKRSETEILAACRENTRNEIRRAEKEGIQTGFEANAEAFRDLYDRFAAVKGSSPLHPNSFRYFWPHSTVTKAVCGGETLVMHAHLADAASKRVTLVYSASLWQETGDAHRKKLISWANRYLHYRDFLFFKSQGYERYDFGPVGLRDGHSLDHFKASFGPSDVPLSEFISFPYWLLRKFTSAD